MTVSIAGLDKAAVLAALFNNSQPLGMGFLNPNSGNRMTREQAARALEAHPHGYFDYLNGRVLKVDLSGDDIDPWLYDRDNGDGALEAAIKQVRTATSQAA